MGFISLKHRPCASACRLAPVPQLAGHPRCRSAQPAPVPQRAGHPAWLPSSVPQRAGLPPVAQRKEVQPAHCGPKSNGLANSPCKVFGIDPMIIPKKYFLFFEAPTQKLVTLCNVFIFFMDFSIFCHWEKIKDNFGEKKIFAFFLKLDWIFMNACAKFQLKIP